MFENTINSLKKSGLIDASDVVIACMDAPSTLAGFGGAIGAAMAMANCKRYILAANANRLRLFDVDKKTAEYLNTYSDIEKAAIQKINISSMFGSKSIIIKADIGTVKLNSGNKFQHFKQKEAATAFTNLIKSEYSHK